MSPLRIAIYARVSSDQQTGDGTIASQVAALEARVAQDGQALACRFIDDGYSGATLRRPALERLRDAAAAGGLQRLYVHSPDRLARRYSYQVLLLDEFQRAGVEVVFLNRPLAGGRPAAPDPGRGCRVRAGPDHRTQSTGQAPCRPPRGRQRPDRRPVRLSLHRQGRGRWPGPL